MKDPNIQHVTVFHCINTFGEGEALPVFRQKGVVPKFIKLPCSSMVKDIFLLRAFEAGADAAIVLVCPEGACRYVEGNLRAKKRVRWVQKLLDEIGLSGARLALFNVAPNDADGASAAIGEKLAQIAALGPSPAR
jgi:coenzyme F420-reducing hydrogenase delta subunit